MKHPFLVAIQVMALVASGFAVDASVLDQRIWTELKYRTTRYAAMVEPEAKRAWEWLRDAAE
jgi:hypothetical protein